MSQLFSPHSRKHLPALDSVRGVAILGVFCFHLLAACWAGGAEHLPWGRYFPDFHKAPPHLLWFYPFTFGWVGVSLFFVLSGFVIHYSTVTAQRSFSLSGFYSRRFWRIYPPYAVALILFFSMQVYPLPASWQPFVKPTALSFITHALLVQDFSNKTFALINPSFWSIATEVQFYLVYPLLLFCRSRIGMTRVLFGVLSFSLAARLLICIAKRHDADAFDESHLMLWASPMITLFDWTLGAFIAERFAQGRRVFPANVGILAGTAALFLASTLIRPLSIFSFQLGSLFCAVWLERVIWSGRSLSLIEKPLIWLGICSYSFYLFHQPILDIMVRQFQLLTKAGPAVSALCCGPVIFMLILLLSVAIYHALEKPSMEFGRSLSRQARKIDTGAVDLITVAELTPTRAAMTEGALAKIGAAGNGGS